MFDAGTIERLRRSLRGSVVAPGEPGYDQARRVYNGMIDKRPSAIARCAGVDDVAAAVKLGAGSGALLSIRGGGHNAGGLGVCDDGLVIDLSGMRAVRVDAEAGTVRVEGGATWGEVDRATHPFGLAVPNGVNSTTGVAGLTLGGGTGHLTRRCGLTIDNLLGAEVVLADGSRVRASEDEHPDLFWALRGGGGNFGVVTAFEFRAHPIERVAGGPMFWPLDRAGEILRWYRDFIPGAPEELNGFFAQMTVPPAPPFPQELQGKPVCAVVWCWTGPASRTDEVLAPARRLGPVLDAVQEMPLPALQSAFDAFYPPGLQWYWRADFVVDVPDAAVEEHGPLRAAAAHAPLDDPPLPHGRGRPPRGARRHRLQLPRGELQPGDRRGGPDPARREEITRWTREYWRPSTRSRRGRLRELLMGDEGAGRVQASYRDNHPRLVQVKPRYDPDNRFRVNHNIDPRAAAQEPAQAPPP
jgi:hypothetical protein